MMAEIPHWLRSMPGRPPMSREQRLLDLLEHCDRALNKNLYPTELEWLLAMSLSQHHVRKALIEFGRNHT